MASGLISVDLGDGIWRFYLSTQAVIGLHARVMDTTIEDAANRLRSREGLEGVLARPQWYAAYDGPDTALEAAVLAHGIAETQPFLDGNKRTALAAMVMFLQANWFRATATQRQRADWILGLSQGLTERDLAELIRQSITQIRPE